jgi:hypothetical protein
MSTPHLARIEAQLERLIEGTFAQLFRQRLMAHDLLLHLTRAFQEQISDAMQDDDPRLLAPDHYAIHIHPDVKAHLTAQEPHLIALLNEHVHELASSGDYRLLRLPTITLVSDEAVGTGDAQVIASHQARPKTETAALQRVEVTTPTHAAANPQLILSGGENVPLDGSIINLGRSRDNDIVLTDPYVSRHHAQLRLRFGAYTLFDNDSQHGTFVNDVRVHEHRLQSGDVIVLGKSQMLYVEDHDPADFSQTSIYPLNP